MINYYKVGGWVRDSIMGIKSKDLDFAVEAPDFDAMRADLVKRGVKIFQERPEYFTIRGNHPNYGGVDFVLCRKDGIYSDGRRPDSVSIGTILDDLSRRDFTCNAIAINDLTGEVLDPFKGVEDIATQTLRCVGDPVARFTEDALRLLRAMRFHITKNLKLSPDVVSCLENDILLLLLTNVSVERIREELLKCFAHNTNKSLLFLKKFSKLSSILFEQTNSKLWLRPTLEEL